jgi:hypothetical protein
MPANMNLLFGGFFRRVRFALACRTEPLVSFIRDFDAVVQGYWNHN